jgi:hypothetical protein
MCNTYASGRTAPLRAMSSLFSLRTVTGAMEAPTRAGASCKSAYDIASLFFCTPSTALGECGGERCRAYTPRRRQAAHAGIAPCARRLRRLDSRAALHSQTITVRRFVVEEQRCAAPRVLQEGDGRGAHAILVKDECKPPRAGDVPFGESNHCGRNSVRGREACTLLFGAERRGEGGGGGRGRHLKRMHLALA